MHLALCLGPRRLGRAEGRRARYYRPFPTISKSWNYNPPFQAKYYEHYRQSPEDSLLKLPRNCHILKTVYMAAAAMKLCIL